MHHTRTELHRVCTHVLARRRFEVSGRFGLRAGPGGIVTPAFGPEPETLRLTPRQLVREIGGDSSCTTLDGMTLAQLAHFAGADLDEPFSAGHDTPALGDPDRPIHLDHDEVGELIEWFELGWRVLDTVVADLATEPDLEHSGVEHVATVQLWPEHFDMATVLPLADDGHVNLGFSPGDGYSEEPYAYVGPWDGARPGDPAYWNAPFGAARTRSEAGERHGAITGLVTFMRRGLDLLAKASATSQ